MRNEITNTNFTYISKYSGREITTLPFRVGDFVKVSNWGRNYATYTYAYRYFGLSDEPFYANWRRSTKIRNQNRLFKIVGMVEHETNDRVLFLIKDNESQMALVDENGLKLVKAFPLRDNETYQIEINKLKHERN